MGKFLINFVRFCSVLGLALASATVEADVLIGMAQTDEIVITNTQENIAYSFKIDEPQEQIAFAGNEENLVAAPPQGAEANIAEVSLVQVASTRAISANATNAMAHDSDIEISIKSTYEEDGNLLVTTQINQQPKHAVAEKRNSGNLRKSLPYSKEVLIAAKKTSVEPALIHAIISAESNYDPKAKSHRGAYGLMQIMPATAKYYKVTDRSDPLQNITAGASLLRDLLKIFKGDVKLSLAAYNAGLPAVLKHKKEIPPYKETQRYVPKVLKAYKNFSGFI